MSNDIVVTWTSDQRKLIEDMQKQILLLQQQVSTYGKVTASANKAGISATKSLADQKAAALSLDLQKRTAIAKNLDDEKKAAQQSLQAQKAAAQALDLQRRIALDENRKASKAALDIERAAAARSLAEQKSAASSLRLQKAAALADQQKDERSAAAKSLAEQKAAAQSLALQKATAIHEEAVKAQNEARKTAAVQTEAAVQSLADQKKAALSLDLQRREAIAKNLADEKAAAASSLQSQKAAAQSLDLQRRMSIDEKMKADRAAGEVVRRSLMSEQQQARNVYRERMRQLFDLRRANAINASEYLQAARQAYTEMKKAGSLDLGAVWRGLPSMITGAVTATALLTAGIRVARSELEQLHRKQSDARQAIMTRDEVESEASGNLDESMTGQEFSQWIDQASKRTGQSGLFLGRAAAGVLGAKGSRSAKDALAALEKTVPYERYNPMGLKNLAGSVLQQQTVDRGASFEEVLGQQLAAMQASRIESPDSFSQHVTYGAVAASAYGDSSKDFYTIAAYLANMGGDPTGQTSGTGAVNLEKQMMELDSGMKLGGDAEGLGASTIERLRSVARNKKFEGLRDQLMGSAKSDLAKELGMPGGATTARARNYGAIIKILNNDPQAWAELEGVGGLIPELGASSSAYAAKRLRDLDTPRHRFAVGQQALGASVERGQSADIHGGNASSARENLRKALVAAGVGSVDTVMAGLSFEQGSVGGKDNPYGVASGIIDSRAAPDNSRVAPSSGWMDYLFRRGSGNVNTREATQEEKMSNDILLDMSQTLKLMYELQKTQPPPVVNVNQPAGDKPAEPPGAGLGGGFHHMVPGGRF